MTTVDVTYNFAGKLAIVTGSTKGIGFGIALAFASAGASVVVHGRSQVVVDEAVASIRKELPHINDSHGEQKLYAIAGDLGTTEGGDAFIAAVAAQTQSRLPDILVRIFLFLHLIVFSCPRGSRK